MASDFPWETVISFVFFFIGLLVGLIQLWQAQKYFLADQQTKFNQINSTVTKISERLATIEGAVGRLVEIDRTLTGIGVTSDSFQNRLFKIVEHQFLNGERTGQVTVEASDKIKDLIIEEFKNSGVVTEDKILHLETKIDHVLSNLNAHVIALNATSHTSNPLLLNISDAPQISDANTSAIVHITDNSLALSSLDTRKVTINGQTIQLSHYEYQILEMLVNKRGQEVSIKSILNSVYNESSLSETQKKSQLHTLMYRLRNKVDPDYNLIKSTEDGEGYIFESNN